MTLKETALSIIKDGSCNECKITCKTCYLHRDRYDTPVCSINNPLHNKGLTHEQYEEIKRGQLISELVREYGDDILTEVFKEVV